MLLSATNCSNRRETPVLVGGSWTSVQSLHLLRLLRSQTAVGKMGNGKRWEASGRRSASEKACSSAQRRRKKPRSPLVAGHPRNRCGRRRSLSFRLPSRPCQPRSASDLVPAFSLPQGICSRRAWCGGGPALDWGRCCSGWPSSRRRPPSSTGLDCRTCPCQETRRRATPQTGTGKRMQQRSTPRAAMQKKTGMATSLQMQPLQLLSLLQLTMAPWEHDRTGFQGQQ
mmetsp:Transcript_15333/g.46311  ORF Transcript_15333/g.46311 Transcript_15333/m.46311 type:complete len:227 (+) Transcript_15333:1554-2234(+)